MEQTIDRGCKNKTNIYIYIYIPEFFSRLYLLPIHIERSFENVQKFQTMHSVKWHNSTSKYFVETSKLKKTPNKMVVL